MTKRTENRQFRLAQWRKVFLLANVNQYEGSGILSTVVCTIMPKPSSITNTPKSQ